MEKRKNSGMSYVAISLLAVLFAVGVHAQSGRLTPAQFTSLRVKYNVAAHNFEEYFLRVGKDIYLKNNVNDSSPIEEPSLGAQPGPDLFIDSIELGSGLSRALSFNATSTKGGLFRMSGPRQNLVCKDIVLNIPTLDSSGGPAGSGGRLQFSVGTTTAAGTATYGFEGTPGIIATTTQVATTSPVIISYQSSPGTLAVWNGSHASTTPFLWRTGEDLVGQFNVVTNDGQLTATSSAYNNASGKVYLDCVNQ